MYMHSLKAPGLEPLEDTIHQLYAHEKLPFSLALEASPHTLTLLKRRAQFDEWANSHVVIVEGAAYNVSGHTQFCFSGAGFEDSSVGTPSSRDPAPNVNCSQVRAWALDDLLDSKELRERGLGGSKARVFFLKIDAEGGDALVLAGARRLLAEKRISYLLFENNFKWDKLQDFLGYEPRQTVGQAVAYVAGHGYKCYFVHPKGLVPIPVMGTPEGERAHAGCKKGNVECARWRIYDRAFWSNVLCAADEEQHWVHWLSDVILSPYATKTKLMDPDVFL